MFHLSATEEETHLDLVFLLKEAYGLLKFDLVIVIVDIRLYADLFDMYLMLMFLGLALFLLLVILKLAEIYDATDWRACLRSYLNQIQFVLIGCFYCFLDSNYPQLIAFGANQSHLWYAYPIVYTDKFFYRTPPGLVRLTQKRRASFVMFC